MSRYEPENPPASELGDAIESYLGQEFRRIAESFLGIEEILLPDLAVVPPKPRAGMIIFSSATDWDPGSGAGFYGYSAGAWVKLG